MPNFRRVLVTSLYLLGTVAHAQTGAFELRTYLDSPIALVNVAAGSFRAESDRRQFFTVKNESDKVASAVVFQQAIGSGPGTEIVALERVSIYIRPRETKRLSVSVREIRDRVQTAAKAGEAIGKPVISVVVVEFTDGSLWSATRDRTHEHGQTP